MKLEGTCVVVTGGASGIGRALAQRFAAEGARGVVVGDRDGEGAGDRRRRHRCGGRGGDVTEATSSASQGRRGAHGPIDLFCSNAGIARRRDEAPTDEWQRSWDVNVMAHVYAARAWCRGCSRAAAATCCTRCRRRGC